MDKAISLKIIKPNPQKFLQNLLGQLILSSWCTPNLEATAMDPRSPGVMGDGFNGSVMVRCS